MADLVGKRIGAAPGVVTNTRFIRCFWPKLDKPTAIFAAGSAGLYVEGPPTPRNVIFPADTTFGPGTRQDCFSLREREGNDEYVAEMTRQETDALRTGTETESAMRARKTFLHLSGDGRRLR